MEVEQVDAVYSEPLERAFESLPDALGAGIDSVAGSESKLGGDEHLASFAGTLEPIIAHNTTLRWLTTTGIS